MIARRYIFSPRRIPGFFKRAQRKYIPGGTFYWLVKDNVQYDQETVQMSIIIRGGAGIASQRNRMRRLAYDQLSAVIQERQSKTNVQTYFCLIISNLSAARRFLEQLEKVHQLLVTI